MNKILLLSSACLKILSVVSSKAAQSACAAFPRGAWERERMVSSKAAQSACAAFPRGARERERYRVRGVIALAFFVLCIGCSEQSTQTPASDPYTKWKSYKLHDYTIDQVHSCFCVNGGERMRITVRADTIAQVFRLSDSSVVLAPSASAYLTIDSLFSIIRNPGKDSLVIVYNAQHGYPEFLDINPQQHPYDGGVLIETSNLRIP
jgi:hypothetical protein